MGIRDYITKSLIRNLANSLTNNFDKTVKKGSFLLEKIASKKHKKYIKGVLDALRKGGKTTEYIKRILKEINPHCKEKFVNNLLVKGLLLNGRKRAKAKEAGSAVPTSILFSPTMRCNLRCEGCYAAKYNKKDDLDLDLIDRVITEAKEMGSALFTLLGGEPFIRKDVFDLFRKHKDAYFQVYTNSTLINKKLVKKLVDVGNVMPELSIEGFEKNTDARRGKGTYKKVMKAMDLLKKNKIPFGFSVCVTKKNLNEVFSDKFVDLMISKGAFIGWYFLYMPVCGDTNLDLMPTPEQRIEMLERGREIRNTKPMFLVDFWNDAPYVGGCIAGKSYIHITSKGDVEPCIFTHLSVDNIKNKSLKEVMNSKYFKALRKKQPFNDNLYLPCQWIDNPKVSRELHKKYKLKPSHPGADTALKNKKLKSALDKYAKKVKALYSKYWKKFREEHKTNKLINREKQGLC
jgi:MoaA/NifB/PqqE/SkfB family radical SAM enzyme